MHLKTKIWINRNLAIVRGVLQEQFASYLIRWWGCGQRVNFIFFDISSPCLAGAFLLPFPIMVINCHIIWGIFKSFGFPEQFVTYKILSPLAKLVLEIIIRNPVKETFFFKYGLTYSEYIFLFFGIMVNICSFKLTGSPA